MRRVEFVQKSTVERWIGEIGRDKRASPPSDHLRERAKSTVVPSIDAIERTRATIERTKAGLEGAIVPIVRAGARITRRAVSS